MLLSMYEPKMIAYNLLTKEGKLNLGMIPLFKAAVIPEKNLLEYQVGMNWVLATMNSSWQPIFDTIVQPVKDNEESAYMLRAYLRLKSSQEITDFHAKWAALAALLSQLTQGAVGDCFAVSWAIKKHNEYLTQSLKDYAELIKNGYLTRSVGGIPERFYFDNTLADDDLQNAISITSLGALGDKGINIWDVPGILNACRMMGHEASRGLLRDAIKPLFANNQGSINTTPEKIIESIARLSVQGTSDLKLQNQILLGKYGFSLTQNHILRAWETAMAGMAEAVPNQNIRELWLGSVNSALKALWDNIKANHSAETQVLITQLQSNFVSDMNALTRCIYNSAIPLAQVSSDGSSTNGGFELYGRSREDEFCRGWRVANPVDLQDFLLDVINTAAHNLAKTYSSEDEVALLNSISNNFDSYMAGAEFMKDLFYAYDEGNKKFPDPASHYLELSMTPMTSLSGDDPFAVEAIDTGISFLPDAKTINPHNPYQLIQWILNLAQWKETTQHYLEDSVPNELDPATSPQHAFNISFEDSDIKAFVLSKQSSDGWIYNKIVAPNLKLQTTLVDDKTKQTFSDNLIHWLNENVQGFKQIEGAFSSSLSHINQKQMDIKTYATAVLSLLSTSLHATENAQKELSVVFDSLFLISMPDALYQELSQTALRFANTNWNQGDKDIYFCVYYNPRSGGLSFGTIDEDRSNLNAMNEYEWVDQQQWEVTH